MKRRQFLKAMGLGAAQLAMPTLLRGAQACVKKPNIIVIVADDLGWAELGCYGNTFNEPPNLHKLAGQGMRFTDAYAAAPVSSPTRAAFLTGQYPARIGIVDHLCPGDENALSTEHVTIAEVLKQDGYATGMIGKWHLSGYAYHGSTNEIRATDHGFDTELLSEIKSVGNGANFYPIRCFTENWTFRRLGKSAVPVLEGVKRTASFVSSSGFPLFCEDVPARPWVVESVATSRGLRGNSLSV